MDLTQSRRDPLGGALTRPLVLALPISTELLAFVAIALVGAILRFWDLGTRMLHHDESLHAVYSWQYYVGRGYLHDPMMHGPYQFHAMALMYFLFGVADATARYAHAISGTFIVVLPYFLRPWLGRTSALITSALLAVSPSLVYFSRFAREDALVLVYHALIPLAIFYYLRTRQARYLYLLAGALSLAFTTKESTYLYVLVVGFFLVAFVSRLELLDVFKGKFHFGPGGDALLVMATLVMPLGAAAPLLFLKNVESGTADAITYGALLVLGVTSIFLGRRWNPRLWTTCAAIFWGIFTVLFTTLFSNPPGFLSGTITSLRYWIEQQDVARGQQPDLYYFALIPLYEFVAVAFGLAGIIYWARQKNLFAHYTIVWFIGALGVYTWAAEKMPWLMIHIALPLVILAGMSIGRLVELVPWRCLLARGGHFFVASVLLTALAVMTLLKTAPPGAATTVGTLPFSSPLAQFVIIVLLVGLFATGIYSFGRKLGLGTSLRLAALGALVVLLPLSIRTAINAAFYNGHTPVEMIVYTQTSPDVGLVMDEIDRVGFRTGTGKNVKVVYDNSVSWPFEWYLRDYTGKVFIGATDNVPTDAPIVLVGFDNDHDARIRPLLGDKYVGQKYRLRWWFPEETYRSFTLGTLGTFFFGDGKVPERGATIGHAIFGDGTLRDQVWRYFFYRELPPSRPLGSTDFMMYVRRDLIGGAWSAPQATAPAAPAEDPYARLVKPIVAQAVIGGPGNGAGQLAEPKEIAVVPGGGFVVADAKNHRVVKLDANGGFLGAWGDKGTGAGQFNEPWGVAVAPDGSVYVADTWNHRIQKFSATGEHQATWGGEDGDRQIGFFGPRSVAVDSSGNVFVTDTGNHRIVKFAPDGQLLATVGQRGVGENQFNEPVGVTVDQRGGLLVADTWNRRIVRLTTDLAFVGAFPYTGWNSESVINKPYLATDAEGNVYAADPESHRVVTFSPTGQPLVAWGKEGTDNGSFRTPTGVTVDASGSVWVTDSLNSRVLRFAPVR